MSNSVGHESDVGIKIFFDLEGDRWHGYATESLWSEEVTAGRYLLLNSPFFIFGISAEDIVSAEASESGQLVFSEVHSRGGHSTYRVIIARERTQKDFERAWLPLDALGCSYEEGPGRLRAIDVPASVEIFEVYRLLERGEQAKIWDFEEGHCGHSLEHVADRDR